MMTASRYTAMLLAMTVCGVMLALGVPTQPKAPTFQRAPHVLTSRDELHVELMIEPHQAIRSVILEVWEAILKERPSGQSEANAAGPLVSHWQLARLLRSIPEPITVRNAGTRTFRFELRPSLPSGHYILIGKVGIGRGLTKEARHQLEVL